MSKSIIAKAALGIQKPVSEVFEAITNPQIMQHYFIKNGSGPMEEGRQILWSFPEFDGAFPVTVKKILPNESVVFVWDPKSVVTINLEKRSKNDTIVRVIEEGYQQNEEGIHWALEQTEGWANFLACMKGWLEYGIHLRQGAFDFRAT